jgi:streptomycin 6-kinase
MIRDLDLPSAFAQAVIAIHGEAGARWLAELPDRVHRCERKWRLSVGSPYALRTHYVAPARTADGTPVVIKLGVAADETVGREARVLERIAGAGAVMLLDRDWELSALLLERAVPGLPLASRCAADDVEATEEAANVLQRIWRPAPASLRLPAVREQAHAFTRYHEAALGVDGVVPPELVRLAEQVFHELVDSTDERMLLHGDLHHGNVLSATRSRWLAIDPHGLVGERAYDCAALLYNPHHELRGTRDLERRLLERVDVLVRRLSLDRERVIAWGFTKAVLSELWAIEDHGGILKVPLRVAQALAHHLR